VSSLRESLHAIRYDRWLTVDRYTNTTDPQRAAERRFGFLSREFG
jgi:hypothetical protein